MANEKEYFKRFIKLIGSGELTSKGMTREESSEALELILEQKATPTQIGAFMIAHRIRRPDPKELAGMIDAYKKLGPKIKSQKKQARPICFGMPFDGRTKFAPIYPLTSLILLSEEQPVILQGGKRMPTKYGVTTMELFESLGLNLKGLSNSLLQKGFNRNGFALIHLPDHFPLANSLIQYRDEIGKRPPIASMELIWTAHEGEHLLVSGFVHPPTEERAQKTLEIIGERDFIAIKGLEGGVDIPCSRPAIASRVVQGKFKRLILRSNDYNHSIQDLKLLNIEAWREQALEALDNKGDLLTSLKWNAAIYLWFAGKVNDINEGLARADDCISSGKAKKTLGSLIKWRNEIS